MKKLRRAFLYLGFALLALALLAATLLTSPVQTLLARSYLSEQADLQFFLDSVSAGFGEVEVTDLQLRKNSIILKIPSLHAQLPIYPAARKREVHIRNLVAKGWTLDLTNCPPPLLRSRAAATEANAQRLLPEAIAILGAKEFFDAALQRWELPFALSLEALDLEGDIIVPAGAEAEPIRIHVKLTGGKIAPDQSGRIEFEATTEVNDPRALVESVSTRGSFTLSLPTPRAVSADRLGLEAVFLCRDIGHERTFSVSLATKQTAAGSALDFTLGRGARRVAEFQIEPAAGRSLAGTWKADLRDADLLVTQRQSHFPEFTATGEGRFELAPDCTRLSATGSLKAEIGRLEVPLLRATKLDHFDVDARFALSRARESIRIEDLQAALAGPGLRLSARSLQSFGFSFGAEEMVPTSSNPAADWLELVVHSLALEHLPALPAGLAMQPGTIAGKLGVRPSTAGLEIHSVEPLAVEHVTLSRTGTELVRDVDLSASIIASLGSGTWKLQVTPLVMAQRSQQLASCSITAQSAAPRRPATLKASWTADLEKLSPLLHLPVSERFRAKTISGDFTASLGATTVVDGTASLVGLVPDSAITIGGHVESYGAGSANFRFPLEVTTGTDRTDLTIEGATRRQADGSTSHLLNAGGRNVFLDHLALVGAPFAAFSSGLQSAPPAAPAAKPIWDKCLGRVRLAFDQLHAGGAPLKRVNGTLVIDDNSVRLEDGVATLPSGQPGKLAGSLVFEAGKPQPYRLSAVASTDVINAARFFPAPNPEAEPLVEGCFAFTDTISGAAANIAELPQQLSGRIQLVGGTGIIRLLKTSTSDATADKSKPVADALVTGTSAFASLFGVKRNSIESGQKSVGKAAAGIRNLNYELAALTYEKASITAVHEPDGKIRLEDITVTARDLRLTGSGYLDAADLPFVQQPLHVSLQLAAHGRIDEFLAASGLGEATTDNEGFRKLTPAIELEGTLKQVDTSRWHDVLVGALRRAQ